MDLGLKDKVAIVTGASRGLGKGIALGLAAEGCRIATCARGAEALQAAANEFAAQGAEVLALPLDLTEKNAAKKLVEATVARFGRVDILVNNIERGGWPVVHGSYNREQWDLEMATTLRAK